MASFDKHSITSKVIRSRAVQDKLTRNLETRVFEAKEELLREFNESEVTKEIEAGPNAPKSAILPGGYGNLFSFFGFEENSHPTEPIREKLETINVSPSPRVEGNRLVFKINVPTIEELEEKAPLKWEPRSWISAITYGIGTFSHYMFSRTIGRFSKSESGTANQAENNIRPSATYVTGTEYVIGFLGKFIRKFKR